MKTKIVFWLIFCLGFFASGTSVILRNSTNATVTAVYVIEGENVPSMQSVNLLTSEKAEKLLKKLEREAERQARKTGSGSALDGIFDGKTFSCEKIWQLKPGILYKIIMKSENGELFLRDDICVEKKSDNLVIEFKKQNKVSRDWLENYGKILEENTLRQKQMQDLKRPLYFMAGFGLVLLLFLTGFIVVDFVRHKKFGEKGFFEKLTGTDLSASQKGKRWMEISGVFLMMVPVVISCLPFKSEISKTYFWFFTHKIEKEISVQATMLTAIAAVFIYSSYLVRYNFFKRETGEQVFFSVVQTIVNVWAIAGLCSMFVGNEVWNVPVLNINSQTCLLLIIILSWIGAKSISGFLWIILVVVGISHITEISGAMGVYGALYVVTFFISLLLQMADTVHLSDFKNDFCTVAEKTGKKISSDVEAGKNALENTAKNTVKLAEKAAEKLIL
ncbi:hypothetical protein [uncultured Treponema sp.]|uniref:hypothetical protein n=1 Tax=uncultured Treponema sp. TaxID=162155 RepID=UPI0015BFD5FB|nr:hypothetical protein [uncultured Treponema sp.]